MRSPSGGTYANGEDAEAGTGGGFSSGHRIAFVVLAVSDDNKRFLVLFLRFEDGHGGFDGARQSGPIAGNGFRVKHSHTLGKDLAIHGQRTLEEGAAGKRNESEPIRFC